VAREAAAEDNRIRVAVEEVVGVAEVVVGVEEVVGVAEDSVRTNPETLEDFRRLDVAGMIAVNFLTCYILLPCTKLCLYFSAVRIVFFHFESNRIVIVGLKSRQ